jgi:rubrerythrin
MQDYYDYPYMSSANQYQDYMPYQPMQQYRMPDVLPDFMPNLKPMPLEQMGQPQNIGQINQPMGQQMNQLMSPKMEQGVEQEPNPQMNELMSQFKPQAENPAIADLTPYKYPDNLKTALQYIREAVEGESEDRQFYEYLISVAPNEADKTIIRSIRDDEIGHSSLFRQVYYMLTGRLLPQPAEIKFTKPSSYCDGLRHAINGEQAAAKKYRSIYFALQDRVLMNILFAIITDELRHGILYNYLYSKNGCKA